MRQGDADNFRIQLDIIDLCMWIFQSLFEAAPYASADEEYDLLTFLSDEASGPHAEFRDSNILLGFLREIHIEVSWMEGINEITVSRTSYLFDQDAWLNREEGEDSPGPFDR